MRTEIIYEDDTLLVVYKPAGLASQSARVTQPDVVSELNNYLAIKNNKKVPYIGVVHRLDQPVEGLLVFARNKKAAAELSNQLSPDNKLCEKHYTAVVYLEKKGFDVIAGNKEQNTADIHDASIETTQAFTVLTDYMVKDAGTNLARIVTKDTPQAKKAVLSYRLSKVKGQLALVEIKLKTGRFHQIRAQLSHAGMPILGDVKYGTDASKKQSAQLQVTSAALCADKLQFLHPDSKKVMSYEIKPHNPAFSIIKCDCSEQSDLQKKCESSSPS